MTRPSSGNIIRDLAASGKEVTPELFKRLAQQRALKEEREFGTKSAALGMAGDIIGKEISASGKKDPLEIARFSTLYDKYTTQIGLPEGGELGAYAQLKIKEVQEIQSKLILVV